MARMLVKLQYPPQATLWQKALIFALKCGRIYYFYPSVQPSDPRIPRSSKEPFSSKLSQKQFKFVIKQPVFCQRVTYGAISYPGLENIFLVSAKSKNKNVLCRSIIRLPASQILEKGWCCTCDKLQSQAQDNLDQQNAFGLFKQ